MTWQNTEKHYGSLSIKMHWLMVFLIAATFAFIECRVFFEKGTDMRNLFKMWHFMLGLTILFMAIIRLYLRFKQVSPKISPPLSAIQSLAAKGAHVVLYIFMIAMPITGWVMLSMFGKPIPFFGFELPALMNVNKELGKSIKEIHELIGGLGYYLIGFHAVAALFHHYIQKDNTLTRMLPQKKG
ncbi:MAG: cytochrome b [Colwellia sp.]